MEHFSCPECGYENPKGRTSCQKCLLVFEKHEKRNLTHHQVIGSPQLESLWRDTLKDYESQEAHEKFILKSIEMKSMPFASQQYRRMLDVNPSDDIAKRMIDKIIQLATITYAAPIRERSVPNTKWLSRSILFLIILFLFVGLGWILFK